MHNRIVIVEKTRVKTLCLSVLNDDNTVVHQICKYKYFPPWYILWAYSIVHQNNENNNNNDQTLNGSFSKKSTVFFTVLYYTGLPSRVFSLSHQNTTKQFINHFHFLTCGLSSIAVLELRVWGKKYLYEYRLRNAVAHSHISTRFSPHWDLAYE